MKYLPNFLRQCQKAYSAVAIESCFEILVSPRCSQVPDLQSMFAGRYGERLTAQPIRNRLHTAKLQSHNAARGPSMTALHHQACLHGCWQHMHSNLNIWWNVIFSNESRFCLRQLDHTVKVWSIRIEHYADCCTDREACFGGGSVMELGSISLTGKIRLVIIEGNLNAER